MALQLQDEVLMTNWKLVQDITFGQQQPNTYRIRGMGWEKNCLGSRSAEKDMRITGHQNLNTCSFSNYNGHSPHE